MSLKYHIFKIEQKKMIKLWIVLFICVHEPGTETVKIRHPGMPQMSIPGLCWVSMQHSQGQGFLIAVINLSKRWADSCGIRCSPGFLFQHFLRDGPRNRDTWTHTARTYCWSWFQTLCSDLGLGWRGYWGGNIQDERKIASRLTELFLFTDHSQVQCDTTHP